MIISMFLFHILLPGHRRQIDTLAMTLLVACAATLATWAVLLVDAVDGVLHIYAWQEGFHVVRHLCRIHPNALSQGGAE